MDGATCGGERDEDKDRMIPSGTPCLNGFAEDKSLALEDLVLSIVGSKAIAWRSNSLVNPRRLMPTLALDFQ
ncbi:MAG: hypothetical protein K9H25_21750 [Rhodospirillum sp.]|nr:hypothetical protein [Rhodospirillum sp.]